MKIIYTECLSLLDSRIYWSLGQIPVRGSHSTSKPAMTAVTADEVEEEMPEWGCPLPQEPGGAWKLLGDQKDSKVSEDQAAGAVEVEDMEAPKQEEQALPGELRIDTGEPQVVRVSSASFDSLLPRTPANQRGRRRIGRATWFPKNSGDVSGLSGRGFGDVCCGMFCRVWTKVRAVSSCSWDLEPSPPSSSASEDERQTATDVTLEPEILEQESQWEWNCVGTYWNVLILALCGVKKLKLTAIVLF